MAEQMPAEGGRRISGPTADGRDGHPGRGRSRRGCRTLLGAVPTGVPPARTVEVLA
ncbi:hypothetical protein V2S66_11520 [Streptomyces sp. V4-01]|uniref:Uncharacterized protein n=1 Tax=Actinacidiphila polyblastidii TaxID=3110430 RepID=A0ABU7PBE8_9ACTN|nr:hypothetical protein [Streptomyces sp. V4-01]